jgi:tetratricopeptide (TPR) repeat protein
MRTQHEQRNPALPQARPTRSHLMRTLIGLCLTLSLLLVGSTASADLREDQLRSTSHTTLWFGRSADVADAIAAWRRNRTDVAVGSALQALEGRLHPRDQRDANSLACMGLTAQGWPQDAIAYCEGALRHGGVKDWRHLNNLANALFQTGRHTEAIEYYERSIALVGESNRLRTSGTRAERARVLAEVLRPNLSLAQAARARVDGIAEQSTPAPDALESETPNQPITRLAGSDE